MIMKKSMETDLSGDYLLCLVIKGGMYYEPVKRYIDAFGYDSVKILFFEEFITDIKPKLNGRVGFNAFNYDYDTTEAGIKYDLDFDLLSFSALLDWHPYDGRFRVSGGIVINQNEVDMVAKSAASQTIGKVTYTAAQIGTLKGNIDFNDVAVEFNVVH